MDKLMIGLLVLGLSLTVTVVYGQENDIYSVLLLDFNGIDRSQNFSDRSHKHIATAYGGAQIDTAQYKFGSASGLFDGKRDYISLPDSDDWSFGSGDFTVDFWVKFNNVSQDVMFINQALAGGYKWEIKKGGDQLIMRFIYDNIIKGHYSCPWIPSADRWYHLAFERNGSKAYIFIDGVAQPLTELASLDANDVGNVESGLVIGSRILDSFLDGFLDEFRISKGIARWITDFTVPNQEYYVSSQNAHAGKIQIVEEGQLVTLDGAASSALSGKITYDWTQIIGPNVVLSDEMIVNPTFIAPTVDSDTNLEFELVVKSIDTDEQSKSDYLTISFQPLAEVQVINNKQPITQDNRDKGGIWLILTNELGEARPAVKAILLVILALVLFFFFNGRKQEIKSSKKSNKN